MDRRSFIQTGLGALGWAIASAAGPQAASARAIEATGRYMFPHGVASGDPTASSVVLWTRVQANDGATPDRVALTAEVALDEGFETVLVRTDIEAVADADHTVRLIVTDLPSDTRLFYRFIAHGDVSMPLGHTRTAPGPDSLRPVRFATASCQNYEQGQYGAWRRLVEMDEAAPEDQRIDAVIHLGDFIYEAVGYGAVRRAGPLPSGGGGQSADIRHAVTLDDYRHLWRTYLSDPDMIAARARFAFIVTWDDHEFSNDSWQSSETYTVPPLPAQTRKVAANQAWFEYVPALLTGSADFEGIASPARDFSAADVSNTAFRDAALGSQQPEPNNIAAIKSLIIHRAFSWGAMVDVVVTDTRSFRSEQAVPAELAVALTTIDRGLQPLGIVRTLDAGRDANDGAPPLELTFAGQTFENPRATHAPGTMLGHEQRDWFKSVMRASRARWRAWANSVPLSPMRLDSDSVGQSSDPAVLTIDAWDGYPSERNALLTFFREEGVANVVSLAGDHHMHIGAVVSAHDDASDPAAIEFATAGISSQPFQVTLERNVPRDNPARSLFAFDDRVIETPADQADAANMTFRAGISATVITSMTGQEAAGLAQRNPAQNPHLRLLDSAANGFCVVTFMQDRVDAAFHSVDAASGQDIRVAHLSAPAWGTGEAAGMDEARIEGSALFPAGLYRQ
ncbi:alkaline phosphatase D family protein [Hyphomonadaceae bacterium ML37]|nr:alkaline phosphatase D family protein [Hyphomonadaceae bacterium ML37]